MHPWTPSHSTADIPGSLRRTTKYRRGGLGLRLCEQQPSARADEGSVQQEADGALAGGPHLGNAAWWKEDAHPASVAGVVIRGNFQPSAASRTAFIQR